ncbi:MAG TPA: hypothetical protein VHC20_01515 [Candidatus Paceibacterota bacterium]|nr:hypothetical protein [Candidatus Paceibacterota bacterium]
MSPAQRLRRILKTIRAWERHDPRATFFGHSLPQFKTAVQPSLEAHAKVTELRKALRFALIERNAADKRSLELVRAVGFAVDGHPAHGINSDFHEALGYTREAVRQSKIRMGRRRKR